MIPYVEGMMAYCDKMDIVFDQYFSDSLKTAVREKRWSGKRYKVQANMKVPRKWSDFLHVGKNKKEWFHFLAEEMSKHKFNKDQRRPTTGHH